MTYDSFSSESEKHCHLKLIKLGNADFLKSVAPVELQIKNRNY